MTLLASANGQQRTDVDDDGVGRPAEVRTRSSCVRGCSGTTMRAGRSSRRPAARGKTAPAARCPARRCRAAGGPYVEALETRRSDVGAAFQTLSANGVVWSARGSWTSQRQDHRFGETIERDDHDTGFAEVTVRRAIGRHTLVGGVAIERDDFQPIDLPRFAYTYTVPGVFVQDDVDVARGWRYRPAPASISTTSSARSSARASPGWSAAAAGRAASRTAPGFSAPTPLTEETEAAGLSRLTVDGPLKAGARQERVVRHHARQRSAVGDADAVSLARRRSRGSRAHRPLRRSGTWRRRRRTRASRRSASGRRRTFRSSPTTRTCSRVKPSRKVASTCP